jgi:hypothetical protein
VHAVVTTWRLHLDVGTTERDPFICDLVVRGITAARAQGVVDVIMIVIEPDRLMAVSLFETLEEALATTPVALAFVADQYAQTLELISRVTGQAYELADLVDLDISTVRQSRESTSGEMVAHLAIWRLGPAIRPPEHLVAFLRASSPNGMPTLLAQGLTDVIVIRTADDTLLVIRLAPDPDVPADGQMLTERSDRHAGTFDLDEEIVGRAFDIPTLLEAE